MTYGANRLVAFLNGPRSVHGVSPRRPSATPRRYVNLIAELPFDLWEIPAVDPGELLGHPGANRDPGRRTLGGDHEPRPGRSQDR